MKVFYKVYIEDILNSIDKIERIIKDKTFDEFKSNSRMVKEILKELKVIGEAAKYIPEGIREQFSNISWTRILGLRNIMEHDFGIDTEIVWNIATENVNESKVYFKQIHKRIEE